MALFGAFAFRDISWLPVQIAIVVYNQIPSEVGTFVLVGAMQCFVPIVVQEALIAHHAPHPYPLPHQVLRAPVVCKEAHNFPYGVVAPMLGQEDVKQILFPYLGAANQIAQPV